MPADVAVVEEADEGDYQRRRQRHPAGADEGEAACQPQPSPPAGLVDAQQRPGDDEEAVDVGGLGKPRHDRERQPGREHEAARVAEAGAGGQLDPVEADRQQADGVDGGVGEPGEGPVEREQHAADPRRQAGDAELEEEAVGGEARRRLEQHPHRQLSVGEGEQQRGGKNAADCISAASGVPTPSYGFHQGTCPCSQSRAARWPSACEVVPTLTSTVHTPGSR